MINLSELPIPTIIEELDFETILTARKERFISLWEPSEQEQWRKTLALESEPVTKLLEESAYMELLLRKRINHSVKASMVAFATGSDLDHIAANFNTQRLVLVPTDDSTIPPTPAVMESDERLRARTQLAFEAVTTAGPSASYKYHAMSADASIADVGVSSPEPGVVMLTVLPTGDSATASHELLTAVYNKCNAETVRPLCDTVKVQSATAIAYNISAELTLYPEVTEAITLELAKQRLQEFTHKHHALGHNITISGIYSALHCEGVQKVSIIHPTADVVVDDVSVAVCGSQTVIVGGRDV